MSLLPHLQTMVHRHARAFVLCDKTLVVIVDFMGISQPHSSLLYNLQFNEGALEKSGDDLYRFSRHCDSRSFFVRFLATREFVVSIRESEIYPDYNKAVAAPRLLLTEHDVRDDHTLVTLLGEDPELLRSFSLSAGMRLTGKSRQRECEIRLAGQRVGQVFIDGKIMAP